MTRKTVMLLGAAALLALVAHPALAQCAMCKTVLEGSPEGQRIAGNLNRAILLMFFAPYLVFGSFMAMVFRDRIRRWLAERSFLPQALASPSRRS
jgi:hypothetical protein